MGFPGHQVSPLSCSPELQFSFCFVFRVVATTEVVISLFLFPERSVTENFYALLPATAQCRLSYSSSTEALDSWTLGGGASAKVSLLVSVCPQRWDRGVTSDVPLSRVSGPGEEAVLRCQRATGDVLFPCFCSVSKMILVCLLVKSSSQGLPYTDSGNIISS